MKRFSLTINVIFFFITVAASVVSATEITVTQFSNSDPPGLLQVLSDDTCDIIILDPNEGVFTMTQDLVINRSVSLEIHEDQNDVIIDGNSLFYAQFYNPYEESTINVNMNSSGKRIIFTRGYNSAGGARGGTQVHCIRPYKFTVNMKYCDFADTTAGSGLFLNYPNSGTTFINLSNCRAYNSPVDNITMQSYSATESEPMYLYLENCEAYNSDFLGEGGHRGDGVTAHDPLQVCYINGGKYHHNPKSGIAFVNGSRIYINGAEFYNNGGVGAPRDLGDVITDSEASAFLENCTFHNLDDSSSAGSGYYHVRSFGNSVIFVNNCVFNNPTPGKGGCPIYAGNGYINVQNSIFDGFVYPGAYSACSGCIMVEGPGKVLIENNLFHNCLEAIRIENFGAHISNNIFHTVGTAISGEQVSSYKFLAHNGYNCFYQCDSYFSDGADYFQPTDLIDMDPLFVDPNEGDFRLQMLSPCLNTGKPAPLGGFTDIGPWQGESIVRDLPENCLAPLPLDANNDCIVNLADLAVLASQWLRCNLDPQDLCP